MTEPMATDLTIVEAKSRFSEFVARAAAGERFLIHRRSRALAVLISTAELEKLERVAELGNYLALALGQDPAVLEAIAAGTTHPIMAAYGLWAQEDDVADLASAIARNQPPTLPFEHT